MRERQLFHNSDGQKLRARQLLKQAVRDGKIDKPYQCDHCGVYCYPEQLHGHHENYSLPYDVIWLCSDCHAAQHSTYMDFDLWAYMLYGNDEEQALEMFAY